MATRKSSKDIIKHIINGTLETTLCRICLKPFGEVCENIFTEFWFENMKCSVADILRSVCQAQISNFENYNVCSNCMVEAFTAYSFYLKFKSTTEFLENYIHELEECTTSVDKFCLNNDEQVCLQLSACENIDKINGALPDFDVENFMRKKFEMCPDELDVQGKKMQGHRRKMKTVELSDSDNKEELKVPKKKRKRFVRKRKSKLHRKEKEPWRVFNCDMCKYEFKTINFLISHHKVVHQQNYCEICSTFYNSEDMESHMAIHGEVYCCDICQKLSNDKEEMEEHIREHEREYICHKCAFITRNYQQMREHMFREHSGKEVSCKFCGKTYKGPIPLQHHMAKHKAFQKNQNISAKQILKVMERGTAKLEARAICNHCGADYVNSRALNMHIMREHTGERPFPCEECGRGYVSKYLRDQHYARVHRPPEYRCPLCPNAFPSVAYVSIHVKKVHLKKDKRFSRGFNQEVTWPTTTVPFEKLRIDVQHRIVEMVRTGDLTLPEEMMTDKMLELIERAEVTNVIE